MFDGVVVCKFFVTELKSRLAKSAKSKEVIETGHGIDKPKRFKYLTSYVFCVSVCMTTTCSFYLVAMVLQGYSSYDGTAEAGV